MFKDAVKGQTFFKYIFESSFLCSPRLHLFDQKYSKKKIILLFNILNWIKIKIKNSCSQFYCILKCNLFHGKTEFIFNPLCWFGAQGKFIVFIYIINVENSSVA